VRRVAEQLFSCKENNHATVGKEKQDTITKQWVANNAIRGKKKGGRRNKKK
jgi:hypothetical protein